MALLEKKEDIIIALGKVSGTAINILEPLTISEQDIEKHMEKLEEFTGIIKEINDKNAIKFDQDDTMEFSSKSIN